MKDSKALYAIGDSKEIKGVVWETELGKIITLEGKINIEDDLRIIDIQTGETISNVDMRNVFMSILPQ